MPSAITGKVLMNEPLRRHTCIGIGGRALYFVQAVSTEDIMQSQAFARANGVDVHLLGGGTNVLAADTGVDALVLRLDTDAFGSLAAAGTGIRVGAGCPLPRLVRFAVEQGLAGAEGLAGIPGSVGGALRMNAGGRHGTIGDICREVTVLRDGRETVLDAAAIGFGYRTAGFAPGDVILGARLALAAGDPEDLAVRRHAVLEAKSVVQPLGWPSCGCVFRNPPDAAAGALIDRCGFKGTREGGIEVSRVHANFFINTGRGRAQDMTALMRRVREQVRERFGAVLEPEIVFLGNCGWPD